MIFRTDHIDQSSLTYFDGMNLMAWQIVYCTRDLVFTELFCRTNMTVEMHKYRPSNLTSVSIGLGLY